ncbi:pyridoxal phosphate-dependent transferase [Durotheca rogersii]|uniref:pyridoxal phosphate-dependent transferase n=1 Tax=Durotheca rogersii TaxID=419775 RepID=UPI00221F6B9D|nr:pyridoxal phosphate-dependent transferase [Durotheca rogersii]KAI5859406.1 pyridoxal phosphate-dependent transferase [Durotheca rogersii]
MSGSITTPFGHAVPPAPRHSVTVHMPGWETVEKFASDPASVIGTFQNVYPRMKPHQDIADLSAAVLKYTDAEDQACLLFSSLQSARECVEYATSERRDDGTSKKPVPPDQIVVRTFNAVDRFFAVLFPSEWLSIVANFWVTPGAGISSRFADANLKRIASLAELPTPTAESVRPGFESTAHQDIRHRIVQHLGRSSLTPRDQPRPTPDDVYLFQTGMASIFKPHTYMLKRNAGTTVLFGMSFINTPVVFEEFGPGLAFFGNGGEEDLRDLEKFLEEERDAGRKVQAIWTEFPANPLLETADLAKLRELASTYDVVLAIDDTIGSWANVDITYVADMLVTSLTKSFNGYADAIAGSVILNPASRKYHELKTLFDNYYVPELYIDDAEVIDHNSRDYIDRTLKLNANAAAIADYLQSCAEDPASAVCRVFYPSINASGAHYRQFMRPDKISGYGCLLSVELEDVATTAAFYDALNVHKGPHLGAPFTLAFAYVMCMYGGRLDWAARYGMKPTQIRVSAGLEETEALVDEFRLAVQAADRVKQGGGAEAA